MDNAGRRGGGGIKKLLNVRNRHNNESSYALNKVVLSFSTGHDISSSLSSSSLPSASSLSGRHGFLPAQVPLPGSAGIPDHVPGAHHALLSNPAGGGPALPGLLGRGGGRGHEDRHLSDARL